MNGYIWMLPSSRLIKVSEKEVSEAYSALTTKNIKK